MTREFSPALDRDTLLGEMRLEWDSLEEGAVPGGPFGAAAPTTDDGEPPSAFRALQDRPLPASTSELLSFHDREFITQAFRVLLRREPDEAGMNHFLKDLRRGTATKQQVLFFISRSPEGRLKKARLRGIRLFWCACAIRHFRFSGAVYDWGMALLRLGAHARAASRSEVEIHSRTMMLEEDVRRELSALTARLGALGNDSRLRDREVQELQLGLRACERDTEMLAHSVRQASDALARTEALKDALARLTAEIGASKNARAAIDDGLYARFEGRFRGPEAEIRKRLGAYVPFIQAAGVGTTQRPVLDIGCGRGEWLALLKDLGLAASGLDLNREFVARSLSLGLDVQRADGLQCLAALPDNSLGALTAFQVLEHWEMAEIIAFFRSASRTLCPGGVLIVETPDPGNLLVGSSLFFLDPTHRRPLPSPLLRFFAEQHGFVDIRILELNTDPTHRAERIDPEHAGLIDRPLDYGLVAIRGPGDTEQEAHA
jgi:O-antigen chain-terminating methyltransferase